MVVRVDRRNLVELLLEAQKVGVARVCCATATRSLKQTITQQAAIEGQGSFTRSIIEVAFVEFMVGSPGSSVPHRGSAVLQSDCSGTTDCGTRRVKVLTFSLAAGPALRSSSRRGLFARTNHSHK